jgi:hypothetical protein
MVLEPVLCPDRSSDDVVKHGGSGSGKHRYNCRNSECRRSTFIQAYGYQGYLPEVKQQIAKMALNRSGIACGTSTPTGHCTSRENQSNYSDRSIKKRSSPEGNALYGIAEGSIF